MTTKPKIYISLAVFVAILLGVFIFLGRSGEREGFRTLEEIVSAGKLRVVSESSSIGFLIENDSISGFQYELLRIFADSLGVELVVSTNNDLHESIAGLMRGQYDIIAKLVPVTTEWIDAVSFTEPLLVSRQMLVQRISENEENQLIIQQHQLAGDTIFIPRNSPHRMRLTHLSDEIADYIYIVEMNNRNDEQLIMLTAEGKIRRTIAHEQLARRATRQYHNLDASLPVGLPQAHSWIVNRQSDELLEKLNSFLTDFIGTNEYWRLYRKYY